MADDDEMGWRSRGENVRATRKRKLDETFHGKRFRIVREVHLPFGQVYQTIFGNKGRHGYVIENVATGEQLVVGLALLRLIHDHYEGVDLPPRRPRGRPPKVRAAIPAN